MLPRHEPQQGFCQGRTDDLPGGAGRGGDGQRHGSMLIRGRATDHGQNHTKACASDAKADQYPIGLHRSGSDCIGR